MIFGSLQSVLSLLWPVMYDCDSNLRCTPRLKGYGGDLGLMAGMACTGEWVIHRVPQDKGAVCQLGRHGG